MIGFDWTSTWNVAESVAQTQFWFDNIFFFLIGKFWTTDQQNEMVLVPQAWQNLPKFFFEGDKQYLLHWFFILFSFTSLSYTSQKNQILKYN